MSQEIRIYTTPNLTTIYALVFYNDSGTSKVRNLALNTWDTFDTDEVDSYDISLTEIGTGYYTADFPTTITGSGTYTVIIYNGDKTGDDDTAIGSLQITWDGSAEYVSGTDIGGLTTVAQFKQFCNF